MYSFPDELRWLLDKMRERHNSCGHRNTQRLHFLASLLPETAPAPALARGFLTVVGQGRWFIGGHQTVQPLSENHNVLLEYYSLPLQWNSDLCVGVCVGGRGGGLGWNKNYLELDTCLSLCRYAYGHEDSGLKIIYELITIRCSSDCRLLQLMRSSLAITRVLAPFIFSLNEQ